MRVMTFCGGAKKLLALGAGLLLTLAATAPAASAEVRFGFNDWQVRSQLPLQVEVGAPIRRLSVNWGEVEASPGDWNWSRFDAQYDALTAAGLQPLPIAGGAPCWARPSVPCTAAGAAPPDPAYDAAWAVFVRRLALRYPASVGVEIWNEPNITPAFLPYPSPARYTELLKAAYGAVKDVDPSMPVVSGGLFVSRGTGSFGIGNAQYLAGMYAAGAKGYMDGIGVHPYPRTDALDPPPRVYDPAQLNRILAGVRGTRDAAGDSSTPIWITEVGESTGTMTGFPAAVTEDRQASDLVAVVRAIRAAPDVRVAIVHRLVDVPLEHGGAYAEVEAGFGVFRVDGSPKPAACALSGELGGALATSDACLDDPPTAADDTATVLEDDPATIVDVLANDADTDGGPRTIDSVGDPDDGTVAIAGTAAELSYQPDPDYCNDAGSGSPDVFAYTLNGGATAQVTVTVACVDDPPDTTRPQVSAPAVELRSDVTLAGGGAAVRASVGWSEATDDRTAGGDLRYRLQQQVDGGSWRGVTGWVSAHSADRLLAAGTSYRFRVLARDAAGNVGRAETADAVAPSVLVADDSAISYSQGWVTNRPTARVYGGYSRPTRKPGSSASFEFSGRALGLVMHRAAAYGTAQACLTDLTAGTQAACT